MSSFIFHKVGIFGLLDFKSVGVEASKVTEVTSCFMDGKCNIITETLLVISYTTSYSKKVILLL